MLYRIAKAVVWLYFHIIYKVEVTGMDNIPDDGALVCPNHFNIADPLLVHIILKRKIYFMAKAEAFRKPIARWFLTTVGTYPVKRGEADLNAIKYTLKLLKDKQLIGLFPEGTRSKTGEMGPANGGVAIFSIKSGKPVVPVAIVGTYKPFTRLKVKFGQPFDFTEYKKDKMSSEDYYEISQIVMKKIAQLKKEDN